MPTGRVVTRRRELDEDTRRDIRYYADAAAVTLDFTGTTDATSALNTIFAAFSAGTKAEFPPGTLKISSQVTLNQLVDLDVSRTVFQYTGLGAGVAFQIGPSTTSAGVAGGRVRGLNVQRAAKDWSTATTGVRLRNVTNWLIDGLVIGNFKTGFSAYAASQACSRNQIGVQALFDNETGLLTTLDATGTCDDWLWTGGDWYYTGSAAVSTHLDPVGAVSFPGNWKFLGTTFRGIAGDYTSGLVPQTGTTLGLIDSGCKNWDWIGCRAVTADTSVMKLSVGANCQYLRWTAGDSSNLYWLDNAASANLNQAEVSGILNAQLWQMYGASPGIKLLGSAAGAHALLAGMDESATKAYFDTSSSGTARAIAIRIGGTEKMLLESGRLKLSSSVLGFSPSGTALTVSSNTINPTRSFHTIDNSAGNVTIKTVTAVGSGAGGDVLWLAGLHATNDVIFDDTGNLVMPGGTITLATNADIAGFVYSNVLSKYICCFYQNTNA